MPPRLIFDLRYDRLKAETDKAYLFWFDDKGVWLPKSQIELHEEDSVVSVPEWLVIEKGIEKYVI